MANRSRRKWKVKLPWKLSKIPYKMLFINDISLINNCRHHFLKILVYNISSRQNYYYFFVSVQKNTCTDPMNIYIVQRLVMKCFRPCFCLLSRSEENCGCYCFLFLFSFLIILDSLEFEIIAFSICAWILGKTPGDIQIKFFNESIGYLLKFFPNWRRWFLV